MNKLIISIVLLNLLAACASDPKKDSAANNQTQTQTQARTMPSGNDGQGKGAAAQKAVDPLNDPSNILSKRSTYYPFDVSAVQDEDKPLVQAHAKYLSENADRRVRLEGNCDERGSTEYNLALGQRRADGVQRMLELGGAKPGQLIAISLGEEFPVAPGHDEASWKQNRRTDMTYTK